MSNKWSDKKKLLLEGVVAIVVTIIGGLVLANLLANDHQTNTPERDYQLSFTHDVLHPQLVDEGVAVFADYSLRIPLEGNELLYIQAARDKEFNEKILNVRVDYAYQSNRVDALIVEKFDVAYVRMIILDRVGEPAFETKSIEISYPDQ
ncbi:MAG: hypothetical protein ABJF04_06275 [Reichenbachiella sp.]|uniref:hypothetical protein n=1 Tax=Reichenbachiella sp. TaxID=2184521 RepID=UPI00326435C7